MEKRGLTGMGIWNTTDYKDQPVTWYSAEEIEKYKQALDEIEKIIKDLKENCVYGIYGKFVNTECLGCVYRLGCYRVSKKEILQKIKAVKDEKEL